MPNEVRLVAGGRIDVGGFQHVLALADGGDGFAVDVGLGDELHRQVHRGRGHG